MAINRTYIDRTPYQPPVEDTGEVSAPTTSTRPLLAPPTNNQTIDKSLFAIPGEDYATYSARVGSGTPEPTVGEAYSNFQGPTFDDRYSKELLDYYKSTDFNENKVRSDILGQFQGEIDATKGAYGQLLQSVQKQGQGRLGEDIAIQSRRGLIGSDFGVAGTEKVRSYNLSEEEKVLAAQAAAIAGIKSRAVQLAQQEVQNKRLARQQGTGAYLEYLAGEPERRTSKIATISTAFLNQGIDPTTFDTKELADIAKGYGVTTGDIINSYLSQKQEREQAEAERQAELVKSQSFNLSEGQDRYQYNPETGRTELVASKAKTYKPTVGSAANAFDLTPKQATLFNSLVNQQENSPLIKAADRTVVLKDSIKNIRNNPKDAAQQLNLSYAYIQALDTYQSAVREGELSNLNSIDSKIGSLTGSIQKIQNGQIVRPEVAKQIANAAETIVKAIEDGARSKAKSFKSRANVLGIGEAYDAYTSGYTQSYADDGSGDGTDVRSIVESGGYDYEAMKADGLSDEEILSAYENQ